MRTGISGWVHKSGADNRAKNYRGFGIPARVIKASKERIYYVYVRKIYVKEINKYLIPEYRVT